MRVLGFVQFFAIMGGFHEWLGIGAFLSFLAALFITYIPLLGQALGVYGAVYAWEWSWTQALLLFVGPWVVLGVAGGVASVLDRQERKRWLAFHSDGEGPSE
jgi:hypothetical protein